MQTCNKPEKTLVNIKQWTNLNKSELSERLGNIHIPHGTKVFKVLLKYVNGGWSSLAETPDIMHRFVWTFSHLFIKFMMCRAPKSLETVEKAGFINFWPIAMPNLEKFL